MHVKWIIKNELFHDHIFDTLDEIDQFFDRHSLPKFTQGIANLNQNIYVKEMEP